VTSQHREEPKAEAALLAAIGAAWGWIGVDPVHVVATNAFGNVLFTSSDGRFWRLCPEDLTCRVVADTKAVLDQLLSDSDFLLDWEMETLVLTAHTALGSPAEGRCYCLKRPAPLGGAYEAGNLGIVGILELIGFSGYIAKQIRDIPPGSQVRLVIK
jgi:hypothetical protein